MDLESTVKCFHQQVRNHTMNLAEYSYPPSSFKKERKGKNKLYKKSMECLVSMGQADFIMNVFFHMKGNTSMRLKNKSIINA